MIGERIKELRNKNNLTQDYLANKLYVSDKTVSSWESNRTMPDFNMILKIFNVSPYYFINGENNNIETEIKLKVGELEYHRLLGIMKEKAKYLGKEKHHATYYNTLNNNDWFRLRNENGKNVLNYKRVHANYSDEYEVIIDNVDNMKKIFELLGLKESVIVEKERIKYLYQNKYEIAFDNVKNLGLFIEIEIKKYDLSLEEEYNNLLKLLNDLSLDLNLISKKRYPEYLLEKDKTSD